MARQDAVIARLEALKAKVDAMSSSSSPNLVESSSGWNGCGAKSADIVLPKVNLTFCFRSK